MKVLVTGGAGFVGRATVRAAVEAGHRVRIVSRDAWPSGSMFERLGVEVMTGDARSRRSSDRALAGIDASSRPRRPTDWIARPGRRWKQRAVGAGDPRGSHPRGDAEVVDISSLVVFALGSSPVNRGHAAHRPGDPAGPSRISAAVGPSSWDGSWKATGLPRVTVHPGTVIGPEDTAMGTSSAYITNLLAGGISLDVRAPWVDVRDVARAIVLALDKPPGRHYLLTSGVVRHRDLAPIIDELTGRKPRRRFLGAGATRRLARVNDLVGGRLAPLPRHDSLDWILDNAAAVDTKRTRADLGMEFRPLRETVADAIRWWAEHDLVDGSSGKLAPKAV